MQKYSNSLSRYLNIDKPSVVTKFKDMQEEPSTSTEAKDSVKESSNIDTMVMATVPKKWKSHASRLLIHIKLNPHIR